MQNQRKNGRPDAAVRMAGLFLALFCVAAVLIPAKTLFTGNGFFRRLHSFHGIEADVCGGCDSGSLDLWGLALLKRGRSRMYWLTAVVLVFSWIHVVFLPMVVSAVYLISLLAIGRFLRKTGVFQGNGLGAALFFFLYGLPFWRLLCNRCVLPTFCPWPWKNRLDASERLCSGCGGAGL